MLGVSTEGGRPFDSENRRLLDALVDQVAVAIERAQLTAGIEEGRVRSETDGLRASLLSSISHDLKTPLASIIGAATILVEDEQTSGLERQRQLAQTIRQEGQRLNRYVQNLLDTTRISYGTLTLTKQWIEPRDLVGRALRQLEIELKGFSVDVDVPLLLPAIKGDPALLEQALVNVLDNAAKYAPPNSTIAISAGRVDDGITFTIDDQGPGIPLEDRERVFDLFYRVGKGHRHGKGTGLGLAISRGILEAHGGTIRALPGESDTGTRIEIHLPLSDSGSSPAKRPVAPAAPQS